jgi:hypothetical protein
MLAETATEAATAVESRQTEISSASRDEHGAVMSVDGDQTTGAAMSVDGDLDVEPATIVSFHFDYKEATALAILSSGATMPATKYLRGDNGFAVAFWTETLLAEWETEVVNSMVNLDGTLSLQPTMLPTPASKKARTRICGKQTRKSVKKPRMTLGRVPGGDTPARRPARQSADAGAPTLESLPEGSAPTAAASSSAERDAAPSAARLQWVEDAIAKLPVEAQPTLSQLPAGKFAYTLNELIGTQAKVSVWLKQKSYYVSNLRALPDSPLMKKRKLNKQNALQVNYGDTVESAANAWLIVHMVITHAIVLDAEAGYVDPA